VRELQEAGTACISVALPPTRAMASAVSKYSDITDQVDTAKVRCLNEDTNFPVANIFAADDSFLLKSDSDEQLLIHLPMKQTVKLWSMNMVAPAGEERPVSIKLYVNKPNMNFQDVDDAKPTQSLELAEEDLCMERHNLLKFTSFQRVDHLTVFIEDNDGGDVSALSKISFTGEPTELMNIAEWKATKG
jgi:hypothetical protein